MASEETLRQLAGECDIETLRGGGPGGQHRNKTETGVRVRHRPTGLTVVCTQHRSQYQNKTEALERLWRKLQELRRVRKKRVATKATRASREKRLDEKKRHSRRKQQRRGGEWE